MSAQMEFGVDAGLVCSPHDAEAALTLPVVHERPVRVFGEAGLPAEGAQRPDWLAAEVPVAMVFNGVSHAVMMATPDQLEAFALGFALSEGILDRPEDCRGMELHTVDSGTAVLPPVFRRSRCAWTFRCAALSA